MSITARFVGDSATPGSAAPPDSSTIGVALFAGALAAVIGYNVEDRGRGLNAAIGFIGAAGLVGALLAKPKAPT